MIILLYILKVTLCSGVLFGYYYLFLRNKRFHHYNRFYLLFSLALSLLLPLAKIPVANQDSKGVKQVIYQTAQLITLKPGAGEAASAASTFSTVFTLTNATWVLYAGGLLLLLITFIRSLRYIRRIASTHRFERVENLRIYRTNEPGTPFSFFRSVFWNDQLSLHSAAGQQIFRHELFHVQQKHSADVMLAEIVCMAGWFNPFFHLIKKELKTIHEFLADQYAASGNDRYAYAELLVQQVIAGRSTPVGHYFFNNHIKRRITMITQLKHIRYGYWSRVMVLPITCALFFSVSLHAQEKKKTATTKPSVSADRQVLVARYITSTRDTAYKTPTIIIDTAYITAEGILTDTAHMVNLQVTGPTAVETPVKRDTASQRLHLQANVIIDQVHAVINDEVQQVQSTPLQDSTIFHLSRFFNRSLRYPSTVLDEGAGGIIHFSFEVDATGALRNYHYFAQPTPGTDYREIVVVGYAGSKTAQKTGTDYAPLLAKETQRVVEKGATLQFNNPITGTYHFKARFVAETK